MLNVTVLLLDDNFASTALGPIEVFHAAGLLWNVLTGAEAQPRFRVTVASVDGGGVTSPYAVRLSPQVAIGDVEHADLIVVPASGLDFDTQFARNAALLPWLRDWYGRGAHIAGVCSGAAFLAEAGLLDGRRATTHWAVAEALAHRYPRVDWQPDMFITEDERLLCSGGVYSAIDLSIYLVEKFCGHEVALNCAKSLLVHMPRSHQSGYAVLPLSRPHSDERIRAVEAFIDANYAENLSSETLAARAHMSPRNFIRRFKAATGRLPGNYLQTLRITVAKRMLEEGDLNIQSISLAVGYEDLAFFRSLFRRYTGMAPGEYRGRFGRTAEAAFTDPSRRARGPGAA